MRPPIFRDPNLAGAPLQTALKKLENWLADRQWSLIWSYKFDDHVNFTDRCVVVNAHRTPQSQIFGILHEMGHIMLNDSPDYIVRFANSDEFKHRNEKSKESLKVRAEALGEEWEAWCLGETFARRAGLEIDYMAYHAARNRDLKSYAKWMLE